MKSLNWRKEVLMPNVEHIHYGGEVHIKTGYKTACGKDLTIHPSHWKTVDKFVTCQSCKNTRN